MSPENCESCAPKGKEARAFFGDYVLRNDKVVVAVADPTLLSGRSASRWAIANVAGAIIDLTLRDEQNDQLRVYYPAPIRFKPDAPNTQAEFVDEAKAHKLPGRQPVSDKRVTLRLPAYELESGKMLDEIAKLPPSLRGAPKPSVNVSYTLEDGWPFVLVEVEYKNPTQKAVRPNLDTTLRADGTFEAGVVFDGRLFFAHDKWWRQGYGVLAQDHKLELRQKRGSGFSLRHVPASKDEISVPSGSLIRVTRRVFPGKSLQDIRVIAANLLGIALERTQAEASSKNEGYVSANIRGENGGPIPCKVEFRGRDGTPDPFFFPESGEHLVRNLYYSHDGSFRQAVPPGKYEVIITHGPEFDAVFQQIEVATGKETGLKATLVRRVQTPGWISIESHNHSAVSGHPTSSTSIPTAKIRRWTAIPRPARSGAC